MKNQGRVTVFLCLIMSGMLLLGVTALRAANLFAAKGKTAIAARSSVSSMKAMYQSYIFEHYHILLFDKTLGGRGEAAFEERFSQNLSDNLSDAFTVTETAITDFDMLTDGDNAALKTQIRDYMKYAAAEYGVDHLAGKVGDYEGRISEEAEDTIERSKEEGELPSDDGRTDTSGQGFPGDEAQGETGADPEEDGDVTDGSGETAEGSPKKGKVKDPRRVTKKMKGNLLLAIVLPEESEVANEPIDMSILPSGEPDFSDFFSGETKGCDFDDIDEMKENLTDGEPWGSSLVDAGEGLAYARCVFNSYTSQDRNEDTVLQYELEYLAVGRPSDYMNLSAAVSRIVWMRVPLCFVYLQTDAVKMGEIRAITLPLSLIVMIPEPVLTQLVAGCWSYAEAVADVRTLVRGKKVGLTKNAANWVTDINNLGETVMSDVPESGVGLSYEDYLTILMSFHMDETYTRMLDLMQLNACREDPEFRMTNAAVGFSVNVSVDYDGHTFSFETDGEY